MYRNKTHTNSTLRYIVSLICILLAIALTAQTNQQQSGKIVMFGNSIIRQANWGKLLNRNDVINSGFSGFTTSHFVWLLKDHVIAYHPSICFLEGGINDIGVGIPLRRIKKNYKSIIDTLRANHITTVVHSVLYQRNNPTSKRTIDRLNKFLMAYSKKRNCIYLDINSKLCDKKELKKEYAKDNTHINDAAYAVWASMIKPILNR